MATYPTDEDIDTTFPDNTTGEIGADDLRLFQKEMTAAGKDYTAITENVPTEFTPATHTHTLADITDRVSIVQTAEAGGLLLAVVDALPGTPDANTIYFVKE